MTVELGALIMTGVGVSGTVLLGVWGMLAHYETRNDKAHADLGRRIDTLAADLGRRIDSLAADVRDVDWRVSRLEGRIDGWYDRPSAPMPVSDPSDSAME